MPTLAAVILADGGGLEFVEDNLEEETGLNYVWNKSLLIKNGNGWNLDWVVDIDYNYLVKLLFLQIVCRRGAVRREN